ncbi:hypothetical protein V6Z11_A09G052700 [Gossypium hirsutum]
MMYQARVLKVKFEPAPACFLRKLCLIGLYKKIWEASFSYPSWFSSSARNLIKRILDPNPLTRITIPEILQDEWFKKGYKPPKFKQDDDVNIDDNILYFTWL